FLHYRIILLFWLPKNMKPSRVKRTHPVMGRRQDAVPVCGIFSLFSVPTVYPIMTSHVKKQLLRDRSHRHRGVAP
ncbi:MAG: hypothetical protein WCA42_02685, partial [Desulfobacterales bacterium]